MGEYYPGQISIGGKITKTDFVRLFLIAQNSNVELVCGESDIGDTPMDLLAKMEDVKESTYGPLRLCSCEAPCGEFPDLMEFCCKHKLTFHTISESKYENDGQISWWKPGFQVFRLATATQSGRPTIEITPLAEILNSRMSPTKKLNALAKIIRKDTPCKLPNLQIIDDGLDLAQWKTIDLED